MLIVQVVTDLHISIRIDQFCESRIEPRFERAVLTGHHSVATHGTGNRIRDYFQCVRVDSACIKTGVDL